MAKRGGKTDSKLMDEALSSYSNNFSPKGFSLNTEVSRKRQNGFYDTIVTTRFLP